TPYFTQGSGGQIIESKGSKVFLVFGDDLISSTIEEDIDLVISLNNIPFSYLSHDNRIISLRKTAVNSSVNIIDINQVGAQGSLIYDGRSMVVKSNGEYFDELSIFTEDLRFYQLNNRKFKALQVKQEKVSYSEAALIYEALVLGIRDYFQKNGFKKALIGFSGGLDSALVGALACAALGPENVKGILMPSMYSTDHSINDAKKLAENLGCEYEIVPIKQGFDVFMEMLESVFKGAPEDVTE